MSSKTVYVTKADGSLQPYDRGKIISVCLRLHASVEEAERVANKIEARLYDGIPTSEIIEMVYEYLGELKPHLKPIMDLREALGAIRSKPDFEEYVRASYGSDVVVFPYDKVVPFLRPDRAGLVLDRLSREFVHSLVSLAYSLLAPRRREVVA